MVNEDILLTFIFKIINNLWSLKLDFNSILHRQT